MLVRILQFLIGALLAGGGGYLAWTHRTASMNVFPPEAAGMPWLVIAGVLGLCAGVVFLVSAVHPRPNTRARAAAKAKRRDETMGAAEAYYSQRDRAADSDWRSGDIAPPAEPVVPPAPEPVKMVEPVRVAAVAPVAAAAKEAEKPVVAPVVTEPVAVAPVTIEPAAPAPAPAAKPVATSAPPEPVFPPLFPSTATLAPIPAANEPPPVLVLEKPVVAPVAAPEVEAKTEAPAAPVADAETQTARPAPTFGAIKAALAAGKIDDAEKLLNAARETAQGLELAELTGLAGDHAAAAGRISNAKWLWRLALKRFGELGAMDTPAAQAVAESLRVAV